MITFDRATIDSAGVFLVGELERLDQTLHMPLANVTWHRDILLREDVTAADEVSSFTNSSFAAAGGITPNGVSWIGKDANTITRMALDIGKTAQPLHLWGQEVSYTIPELVSAQKAGRPVDAQKTEAMKLKYQMDLDMVMYIGDATLNFGGLLNHPSVTNVSNVSATGTGNATQWASKTADNILDDINGAIGAAWAASAYSIMPSKILVPPMQYQKLLKPVTDAGNQSTLMYVKANNLLTSSTGRDIEIQPVKWLVGRGAGGTDRMVVYTQEQDKVRFPLVPLQRTPLEWRSLYNLTTYWSRVGQLEVVYPETAAYLDGI